MIQFNLLPDVKIEFIKATRAKRTVMMISFVAAVASLSIMGVLFAFVQGAQKKHMKDLSKDIQSYSSQLKGTSDLNKILTIQNQLNSLTALHEQKPAATRLLGYLTSITPTQANITKLNVDFVGNIMSVTGEAVDLSVLNKYVDTLKFTTYRIKDSEEDAKAFSNVVVSNFARDNKTTFQIDCTFDPLIFDGKTTISLTVPETVTTRSETEKPNALFGQ